MGSAVHRFVEQHFLNFHKTPHKSSTRSLKSTKKPADVRATARGGGSSDGSTPNTSLSDGQTPRRSRFYCWRHSRFLFLRRLKGKCVDKRRQTASVAQVLLNEGQSATLWAPGREFTFPAVTSQPCCEKGILACFHCKGEEGSGVQNRSQSHTGILKGYFKVRRLQPDYVEQNNPKVTYEWRI